MIVIIIFIVLFFFLYIEIDPYIDKESKMIWYTSLFTGERKFIKL